MESLTLQKLAERWPSSLVARTEVERFTGGIFKEKYLANLDCQGKGPEGRIRIGRKIAYPVESLISFLEQRMEIIDSKQRKEDL